MQFKKLPTISKNEFEMLPLHANLSPIENKVL